MSAQLSFIKSLSLREKLELFDELWAEIAADDLLEIDMDPELLAEIQRRDAEYRAHPEKTFTLDEALRIARGDHE